MNGEPRRVDPEFDELAVPDVPLDDIGRDVEVFWVLAVHGDPVHQLVIVAELLAVEFLLQSCHHSFNASVTNGHIRSA